MATAKQIKTFIDTIAPCIQKYAKKYGYKVASPIIAQACLESAYGTSKLASKYFNYFGMKCGSSWKGASVNMATKEEYTVGTLTDIRANFRAYDDMDAGVKGYFDFISAKRYANLKTAKTAREYLEMIKADGYATSSTYVKNNMTVVDKYNLTQFDDFTEEPTQEPTQEQTPARTIVKVFNCYWLNCRDNPNGKIVGVFKERTKLEVIERFGDWVKVTGKEVEGRTVTGYCAARYLKDA